MPKADRIARIRDNLATIAIEDTNSIIATAKAMRRMADLGLDAPQVRALLISNPKDENVMFEAEKTFFGFDSRRQASLAAWGGTRKADRPGAIGDMAQRVDSLIKNQVPERAAQTIGLAIISVPAMAELAPPAAEVKRFKRSLKTGKLHEVKSVIDVEAEVVEDNRMMKRIEK